MLREKKPENKQKMGSFKSIIEGLTNACPPGTAVIFDDMQSQEVLSYRALSLKVKEIAEEIEKYVKGGDYVCIDAQNSLEIICVIFSLLMKKIICCPLSLSGGDVTQSLLGSGVKFAIVNKQCLTTNHDLLELKAKHELIIYPVTCLKDFVLVGIISKKVHRSSNKEDIDFVIRSSGSSGQQKVISVPGKCILPNIVDLSKIFNLTSKDVIFMSSPLTFDASIVQIFIAVIARATLLIVPDAIIKQVGRLSSILFQRHQTTIFQATPSLFHLIGNFLLANGSNFSHTSLRVLCLGAEPFPSKYEVRKLIGNSHCIEVYNIYGISEVSSWASIERIDLFSENLTVSETTVPGSEYSNKHLCDEEFVLNREVSIGSPLSHTKIELRNESGTTVFEGYGEIWIGGKDRVCLIGDEEDILQNTMRPSGDIGFKKNGKVYYLRRKDNKVKILGKFFDLEQIEHVAEEIDAVISSICIYSKEKDNFFGSLILFLAIREGVAEKDVKMSVLRRIHERLSGISLHFRIIFLTEVPLNSHGKKDRLKLQRQVVDSLPGTIVSEFANLEHFLLNLFANVIDLQSSNCNTYDKKKSFLGNGGDSVAAIFLESQICDYVKLISKGEVTLTVLYDRIISSSLEELSEYLFTELQEGGRQGFHGGKSGHYKTAGCLKEGLKTLEEQGHLPGKLKRQDFLSSNGASHDKMVMKEAEINGRCTDSNDRYFHRGCTPHYLLKNDQSFIQRKKRKPEQYEQKCPDAKQNLFESSLTVVNQDSFLSQENLESSVCFESIGTREQLSNKRIEFDPEIPLNNRLSTWKSYQVSTAHNTDRIMRRSSLLPNGNNPSRTMQCMEDTVLCSNADTVDCYCSVTRGSKYTVCDNCIARGSKSTCLSKVTSLNVESLTVIRQNWLFDTLKCVDASPLIVCNGNHSSCIVYIGSHSHFFYAINADDGKAVWKTKLGDRIESSAAISKYGKSIIVGCYDHYIYIISRQSGDILWQLKTGESVKCSPVVSKVNGFVFVGSHDHHVYAINTQTCSQIWRTYCGGGSIFGSPAFSDDFKLLFVGTLAGNLVAIDSETGVIKWRLAMDKPIFTSPLCIADHVYFSCVGGYVHAVTNTGTLSWSLKLLGPIFSSPSVAPLYGADRFVVGSHDKAMYCISNDGQVIWRTQLDSPIFATPTIVPLQVNHSDGLSEESQLNADYLVLVSSTAGKFYALNFITGAIVKTHTFSNEIFSSPVLFKSSVVVGCRDNNVYCLCFECVH